MMMMIVIAMMMIIMMVVMYYDDHYDDLMNYSNGFAPAMREFPGAPTSKSSILTLSPSSVVALALEE